MPLKIDNFFRYYMFNLDAKELSSGEKLKATIAAVAIGVFSLGLIPLICRVSFYDKSFKIKNPDEESKTSKIAEKLGQEKDNQKGESYNKKNAKKTELDSSSKMQKTVEVPEDASKLSVSELQQLAKLLTADQLASIDLFHIREDKARFDALFNTDEPKTREAIQKFPNTNLSFYNKIFSKKHWNCLTDKQVCYVLNYKIPNLQLAVDALFNEDPERLARIKLSGDQRVKIAAFLTKSKEISPKKEAEIFPDLSALSAKEISNLVKGKTLNDLAKVLRAQNKSFEDKEKFKAFFDMSLPVTKELFDNASSGYLALHVELFSDEHWNGLDDDQAKRLVLTLKDPKLAIEKLLGKDEARFQRLKFNLEELKKLESFLTPNLLQIVTNAHQERIANLENFSDAELWKFARYLTDSEVLNYDFHKVKNKDPLNLKKIINALYPPILDQRKDRCIPKLSNAQIALMCNGFNFQHWECLNDDQALNFNLMAINGEEDRENAAIALFFVDKNQHRLSLLDASQKKQLAEFIKVRKYHLTNNKEHFPDLEEIKPVEAAPTIKESQAKEISPAPEEQPVEAPAPSENPLKVSLETLTLEELEKRSSSLSDEEILGFDFSKVKKDQDAIFLSLYDFHNKFGDGRFERLLTNEKIYELSQTMDIWKFLKIDQLGKLDLEKLNTEGKKSFITNIIGRIRLYVEGFSKEDVTKEMTATLKGQIKANLDEMQAGLYGSYFE